MSIIVHGDSTAIDYEPLLDGRKVRALVTDPPFGMDYQSRRVKTDEGKEYAKKIEADGDVGSALATFDAAFGCLYPHFEDEAEVYIFTMWSVLPEWISWAKEQAKIGFAYKMLLVWDKGLLGMGDIDASWGASHEFILYLKRGRRDINGQRSSILHFDRLPPAKRIHPTEKPVGLLEALIKASTDPGDVVVDTFSGSGSTAVAARNLGRFGIGVEQDSKYIEPSQSRLTQRLLF